MASPKLVPNVISTVESSVVDLRPEDGASLHNSWCASCAAIMEVVVGCTQCSHSSLRQKPSLIKSNGAINLDADEELRRLDGMRETKQLSMRAQYRG